ncbi:MAG: DEAD/DEAH box helicase [Candidatus Heimdallarchaeota archaeon]|nr:DEAD/DEAH box helicase [Candidatus Heimdallarchaeota archaeon]
MIEVSFLCPLCSDDLVVSKAKTLIDFTCQGCGFKSSVSGDFDVNKAYESMLDTHNKQNQSSKKRTQSFPTRTKRRRYTISKSEKLEEDQIINQNAKEVKSLLNDISLPTVLSKIINDHTYLPVYINHFPKTLPESDNEMNELGLDSRLVTKLVDKGIEKLYNYQQEAFNIIRNNHNLIITAPTGLGKTEAFLLPIIQSILDYRKLDPVTRTIYAMFIYPTKALAADQFEKINDYTKGLGVTVAIYDGDTPQEARKQIYKSPPDILITNPDMIHYHLMRNLSIQGMIKTLKFIVLDEIHLCVSSYGTNIIWILRRLRRFSPKFISIGASATISNAKSFAETLFDGPVQLLSVGNARKSDLYLTMIYPKERSNLSTMAKASTYFLEEGYKTLLFGNGHLSAESMNLILKQYGYKSQIHRAGLPVSHRKRVENSFRSGKLDALVSTPTLELGIDIGSLDSVVSMLTSVTSFVQRIGRAGRQGQQSYATLVLRGDDPISAYYARNPEDYLSAMEPAFVEPNNSLVSYYQILAMLLDKPLTPNEIQFYDKYLSKLLEEELIIKTNYGVGVRSRDQVQEKLQNYSIRGIGNNVSILHEDKIIGERVLPIGLSELHPGAIYLHGGNSYYVDTYNSQLHTSKVRAVPNKNIRTKALRKIWPRIESIEFEKEIEGLSASYCKLNLTETVDGYLTKDIFTNRLIGSHLLEEPISYQFDTMGFILSMPKPYKEISHMNATERSEYLMGSFHAVEHILIESGNSLTGGGANQIGGISMADTGHIFVYDGTEGGSGLSNLLFDSLGKGFARSLKILEDCPCKREDGCPRCTYSYYCGNNNQPLNRLGAIETLKLVGKESTELDFNFDGVETFVIDPVELPFVPKLQNYDLF